MLRHAVRGDLSDDPHCAKSSGVEDLVMHLWSSQSFAALLLASTVTTSAIAATP